MVVFLSYQMGGKTRSIRHPSVAIPSKQRVEIRREPFSRQKYAVTIAAFRAGDDMLTQTVKQKAHYPLLPHISRSQVKTLGGLIEALNAHFALEGRDD